jgi:dolichol kinase
MNQDVVLKVLILPIWGLFLGIPILIILVFTLISTGLSNLYKKIFRKDISKFKARADEKVRAWSKLKKDVYRKLNHVLVFISLIILWIISLWVVISITKSSSGMIPIEENLFLIYLSIFSNPNSILSILYSLGWFYYVLFFFFYTFCLLTLASEFARKSHRYTFPFNFFTRFYLSEEEKRDYGTYLVFFIGHMFAAFISPPMVFFAILGVSSIADLMTSQIGIRFGKKPIFWNKNKTWEGSIAGFLTAFLICVFFIGFIWALVFACAFLVFDIITNKPLKLSDNLLTPLGLSLLYLLTRFFFNFGYSSIILGWFS